MAEILSQEEIEKLLNNIEKKTEPTLEDLLKKVEKFENKISEAEKELNKTTAEREALEAEEKIESEKNVETKNESPDTAKETEETDPKVIEILNEIEKSKKLLENSKIEEVRKTWQEDIDKLENELIELKKERKSEEPKNELKKEIDEFISKTQEKLENKKEGLWDKTKAVEIDFEDLPKTTDEQKKEPEQKENSEQDLGQENIESKNEAFLNSKEEENEKTQKESKIPTRIWQKGKEYWKTGGGKEVAKNTGKVLALSGITIGLGAVLGITPTNFLSIAGRMGFRGLSAIGTNMFASSDLAKNLSKKIFKKKEEDLNEKKNWFKREFGWSDLASVGGIGAALALSGGTAALIGAGGFALRKTLNTFYNQRIKNLENINTEESLAEAKKLKFNKNVWGGALTVVVGLATMKVYHDKIETEAKHDAEIKQNNIDLKTKQDIEIKAKQDAEVARIKHENEIKEVKAKIENALIGKCKGYEHSFIKQIENDPKLAEELAKSSNFKGDLSDPKVLHTFAQHEAHIIAIKEGIIGKDGEELRVMEANKIAPIIEMKDGKIILEEKNIIDGKIETNIIHQEGDKFGEHLNKYEHVHTDTPINYDTEKINTSNINTQTEAERLQNLHDINSNIHPRPLENIQNPENHIDPNKVIEYDDTSKNTGSTETEHDINNNIDINTQTPSPEILEQINETYKTNLAHIFPKNIDTFEYINKTMDAKYAINQDMSTLNDKFKPFFSHMHKLEEITDLHPREATLIQPIGETVEEFLKRGYQKAIEMGKLDKIKI